MEKAEIKRLLYVACTRAEDHLVFFAKNRKNHGSQRPFLQILPRRFLPLSGRSGGFLSWTSGSFPPALSKRPYGKGFHNRLPTSGQFGQAYKIEKS
jgi:hypothetical protein